MRAGDHIRVRRPKFWHHGICEGNGRVIHYTFANGPKRSASIRRDSIEVFAQGAQVEVVLYARRHPADETLRRARSRLGEIRYDVFGNNCEHFSRWCVTGEHRSEQIDDLSASAGGAAGGGGLAAAGLGVVSSAGIVEGLSGPGIMSGLAQVGAQFGGGATTGVLALGVAPAVVTTAAMLRVLRDDPFLPDEERNARSAGRKATVVAAAAGTVLTVQAVSAAGAVAGLSGPGIASGLAALGKLVGGGMKAGAFLALLGPALLAVGVGYLIYRRSRRPAPRLASRPVA